MVQPYIRPIKIERWFVLSIGSSLRTFCICHTIGFVDADKGMESLCQTSFSSPSDMAATEKGWGVYARKQNFTPSIFGRCEIGWKVCAKQVR